MLISKVADMIITYIKKNDASALNDDYSVVFTKYGIEITLSSLLNIFIILILSLITDSLFKGIVFLLVFISTRQYTGGFHASSYFKCNVTFAICFTVVICAYKLFVEYYSLKIWIVLLLLSIVLISFICPISNPNKPIRSKNQFIKCKIISILLFAFWSSIGAVLLYSGRPIGNVFLITLQLIMLLCLLSKLLERRRSCEHT